MFHKNKDKRVSDKHLTYDLNLERANFSECLTHNMNLEGIKEVKQNSVTSKNQNKGIHQTVIKRYYLPHQTFFIQEENNQHTCSDNLKEDIGRRDTESFPMTNQSRTDNVIELKVKKPNIHLLNNLFSFNDRKKTVMSTSVVTISAENLPTGNNDLKWQIYGLQKQNDQLKCQNQEFANKVETLKIKIKSLEDENQMLIAINKANIQENE
ncbi:9083_t:CDS:2 [Funneliformis geosporum]|uniref:14777_t:CDS:1 n=1 Tax=Funneliformis geosporum TaxID=1117311 RepID=A0A9W4X022_9GLOM|nr:9083_t:CDS:2 [Funneliformis geosporum]CAI2192048.1 14777_t:CDS:2 [Funneliformis geosporum]